MLAPQPLPGPLHPRSLHALRRGRHRRRQASRFPLVALGWLRLQGWQVGLSTTAPPWGAVSNETLFALGGEEMAAAATEFRRFVEATIVRRGPSTPSETAACAQGLDLDRTTSLVDGEADVATHAQESHNGDFGGILDYSRARTCHGSEWGERVGGCTQFITAYRWPDGLYGRAGEISSTDSRVPDAAAFEPADTEGFGHSSGFW